MALTVGARLGPYGIVAQIGSGRMGEVYRATDTNLKRAVAIKVLPDTLASDVERLAAVDVAVVDARGRRLRTELVGAPRRSVVDRLLPLRRRRRHQAVPGSGNHACCVEVPASWSTELTFCATPALKFCATPAVCTALLH